LIDEHLEDNNEPRIIVATRYLVIVPIIGLAIAAAVFFVFGGINMIVIIFEALLSGLGITEAAHAAEELPFEVEIIEHVYP
jgi:uncharacterized membrane protein YqhA